jgi:hypothetical protein
VRHGGIASRAARCTTIATRHLGRGARFIDEDEFVRIESALVVEPGLTVRRYVRPFLFGGVRRFFYRSNPAVPHGADTCPNVALRPGLFGDFRQGDVFAFFDQTENEQPMRL